MNLRLHAREPRSRANGPGVRAVVWVQGCSLGCPGCFNPDTHAPGAEATPVRDVVRWITGQAGIDGLTVSGGEPFEQPDGLLALVRAVRADTDLSILVFSGYTIDEIRDQALGPAILDHIDVLIDGRYRAGERVATAMRGSANQSIHCLTDRHTAAEIEATPEAELRIAADGSVTISGVAPVRIK